MPALLEPPRRKSSANAPGAFPRDDRQWVEKFTRSGYFLGAVLLHLLIFLIVATWVVFKAPPLPQEDPGKMYIPSRTVSPPTPPPTTPVKMPELSPSPSTPTPAISVGTPGPSPFTVKPPELGTGAQPSPAQIRLNPSKLPHSDGLPQRLPTIKKIEHDNWGRPDGNVASTHNDPKGVIAHFPVYLASYADGDWAANVVMKDGQIVAGSLPDFVAKMNEWSHNNIKGTMIATPLDIGSPELLNKMPPFVYFTGHKDFVLTDNEIAHLREYLNNGGAIWGDNALPGFGSRFDVAFHREMKRVIPDKDKNFEEVPPTHPIFTKSWFNLTSLPQGMNFYDEPMEHLDLDGKVAILYTPNDYSDLYAMRVLPGDKAFEGGWRPGLTLYTNTVFLENSGLFFRNFNLPASLAAQQLGMNIIGFLLVRFDDDLLLLP